MTTPTKEQAFETAIVDGINIFVREALNARGFLNPAKADDIGLGEILELKYRIARDLARKWSKMRLQD